MTSNQFPIRKIKKKTTGTLWYYPKTGGDSQKIASNLPFPILQAKKKELVMRGWKKEKFLITY